jgi:hypothetical protein
MSLRSVRRSERRIGPPTRNRVDIAFSREDALRVGLEAKGLEGVRRGRTDRRGGRGATVSAGRAGFAYALVLVPVAVSVSSAFSGLKNTRSVTTPWTVSPGRSISSSTPSALWSTLTIA